MNLTQPHNTPLARFVAENIVPAVGAVVLALIIRSFAVQPFTIPTGSMEPTLHGDYTRGDKILADKAAITFSDPQRLDVAVFKFPEDVGKKRDFIKRLVGLPGEKFQIDGGDVYINDEILRKPLRKQSGIWIEVEDTSNLSKQPLSQAWRASQDMPLQNGSLLLDAGQGLAWLSYQAFVTDSLPSRTGGGYLVGDLMTRLDLAVVDTQAGKLDIVLRDVRGEMRPRPFSPPRPYWELRGTSVASISFNPQGVTCSIQRNKVELSTIRTKPWKPDEFHTLEFSSYDNTVNLLLDGKPLISERFDPSIGTKELPASAPPPVTIKATDSLLTLRRIGLYRDIYWTNADPWALERQALHIPEGHYVVLGDNSPSSEDSRRWRTSPFVPRENFVARATVIFWPPWRWRIIP